MKLAIALVFIYLLTTWRSESSLDIPDIINKHKQEWGIEKFKIEQAHYFDLKINHCFKGLLKEVKGEPTTYFLYKNGLCVCIIEEIEFKNKASLENAYKELNKEADKVRTGKRTDFGNICFEPREAQFFYALNKEGSLYLFSDGHSYNYRYDGGQDSNDAIINRDQKDKNEIVFDDIYRLIKSY